MSASGGSPKPKLSRRYALWIVRRRWWIVAASIAFAAVAAIGTSRLDVRTDVAYLLPQSARSVEDLHAIEQRARVIGTVMVAVVADDPAARRRAAVAMRDRIVALGPELVASVTFDRRIERQYAWDHRWLFADLADLESARVALADELARAKLAANPLYVALDDAPPATASADKLRAKLVEAERARDDPGELVSADGRVQMMIVRTSFSSGNAARARSLVEQLDAIIGTVRAPGVDIGVAGDIAVNLAEHDAILHGMLRAALVTVTLVLLALIWYFRSPLAIGALSWSLVVGTLATFAFARLALGYLNLATAFLSSIVIGNGINVGILVTARYLEEQRAGHDGVDALARALEHTITGTFAAALTAAVAYASLVVTVFRGFRHFGIIASVGILLCWVSAYVVLPAALSIARDLGMRPRRDASLGRWLLRIAPRRVTGIVIATTMTIAVLGIVAIRYLADDPFESNFRNLRSQGAEIAEQQRWLTTIDQSFGQGIDAGFVIAVAQRDEAAPLVASLRELDRDKPERARLFSRLVSLDSLLPSEQPEKLVVLAEIRALMSDRDLDALDDAARRDAVRLRPPDGLRPLGDADVPDALAWPFVEADGTRGKLVLAAAGKGYNEWDAHDTVRFSTNVRALDLPADVHLGGASFVFADVLEAVLTDGPRATFAAAAGALLVVLLVLGRNRFAFVTLVCGASGTLVMLGSAALLGFKINFLDFVALPITIGIGVEYAVNIVTRVREEGPGRSETVLGSTGGAVLLCSYTTIVGYGSLLLSQNLGIRSFGLAALLGELACLVVALVLAPALLELLQPRSRLAVHVRRRA